MGVKSPALESRGLVGGLVEMWNLQSEAAESDMGEGTGREGRGHAVCTSFTAPNYRLQDRRQGQKE